MGMVVMFLSPRGISLRELPTPLPKDWHIPVVQPAAIRTDPPTKPDIRLHRYVKVDALSYVEREETPTR